MLSKSAMLSKRAMWVTEPMLYTGLRNNGGRVSRLICDAVHLMSECGAEDVWSAFTKYMRHTFLVRVPVADQDVEVPPPSPDDFLYSLEGWRAESNRMRAEMLFSEERGRAKVGRSLWWDFLSDLLDLLTDEEKRSLYDWCRICNEEDK